MPEFTALSVSTDLAVRKVNESFNPGKYMKQATDRLKAGNFAEAIPAVIQPVRDHPTDDKARTFLFELLCFSGEYDRA